MSTLPLEPTQVPPEAPSADPPGEPVVIAAPVSAEPSEPASEVAAEAPARDVPPPRRGSASRRVLGLASPVIGENLLQTLLGVVDTILVAALGAVALAGVGTALQVVFLVLGALTALSVGASVLTAQAFGARDYAAAGRIARQAVLWSILLSIPVSVLGIWFSSPLIGLFGVEPDVAQIGTEYLQITLASTATMTIMLITGGVLRGVGDSRTPMLVTALANIVNIGLSIVLIFGYLGAPALGAAGSAWGTLGSRVLGSVILIGVLWVGRNGVRMGGGGSWRPHWPTARAILGIGLPAALEEVLVIAAFAALTPIVAALGTVALAAHRVVLNILSLSFLPGIGFGVATTALVGQAIGARDPADARAVTRIATVWATVWMGGLGIAFLIFASQFIQVFSNDPQMIAVGTGAVQVVALAQIFWAATFVFGGALRGAGDTRTPLIISSTAMWVVVGIAYLAVTYAQPSLAAVWVAFLFLSPLEALLLWRAWRARVHGIGE